MVGEAFATNLLRTAACAHRVDQLDAIGVDDPEHGRGSQEALRPVLMRPEQAKEPGPLGEARKQRAIITRQPTIEGPVPPPLRACNSPKVTTSLGQRYASGRLGSAPIGSSIAENNAVLQCRVRVDS